MRPTHRVFHSRSRFSAARRLALGLWAAMFLFGGCAAGAKPSAAVRHYVLEYPSPVFPGLEKVSESVRVEPLSISRTFGTTAMVYRTKPFVYGDDAYNRWKTRPSVMISDLLLRDMRSAGLFGGVFSGSDAESGDYVLGGVIEEFYEHEQKGGGKAVLALNATLLGRGRPGTGGRPIFQKSYRTVQPMEACDAESMARAMSKAVEALSREVILDTYQAMQGNSDAGSRAPSPRGLSAR